MNKLERKRKGYFKFLKRIKVHGFSKSTLSNNNMHNLHAFKTTGTPCSCPICSPGKIEEKAKYREKLQKPHHSIDL